MNIVEVAEDESTSKNLADEDSREASLTHNLRGHKALAVPAVRRIALENKVCFLRTRNIGSNRWKIIKYSFKLI